MRVRMSVDECVCVRVCACVCLYVGDTQDGVGHMVYTARSKKKILNGAMQNKRLDSCTHPCRINARYESTKEKKKKKKYKHRNHFYRTHR